MKIARIAYRGRTTFVQIEGDYVSALGGWVDATDPQPGLDLNKVNAGVVDNSGRTDTIHIDEVTFLPPVGSATKIICLGVNFKAHIDEVGEQPPEYPAVFIKMPDALTGHLQPVIRPVVSDHFDFEGEIAVVIGMGGRHISRQNAMNHVLGYTIMMDGSVRDFQKHSPSAGKNFFASGSLGPWIVTPDEVGDWTDMRLETRLSGTTVQSTRADLMIYDVATAIEYISKWTPLAPGDVIATGTPSGVGARRTPPLWMKAGDVIEVEVSFLGTLTNPVADER